MKKSILILFVLLSQVCMAQNLQTTLEVKPISESGHFTMKTIEYYQRQDSVLLSIKKQLDNNDSLYVDIINKWMNCSCNCKKKKLKK